MKIAITETCLGTNTEVEDKQLPLEKMIRDLQQENESLQRDVLQKDDYLQQTISTQRETVLKLGGEHADRSDLCCLGRVCVCFRNVIVWGKAERAPH